MKTGSEDFLPCMQQKQHSDISADGCVYDGVSIFREPPKPKYKPDNRIAVKFCKIYCGHNEWNFLFGNSDKLQCEGEKISKYVELLDQYNDQDDNNAELSKICSIYGKGYEMYYVDQEGRIGITYLDPQEAFIIYDDL